MNKEEIILMAIEAGWDAHHAEFDTRIQTFAVLVASVERSACAKQLDALGCDHCATAIRAKSKE
jgi:hypothetical protein